MNSTLTRIALLAGVVYFCCMALAHFFSFKVPVLFVYYDTPFHAYQDKIISFAVIAYAALFYLASTSRDAVPAAILVLGLTVLGLASVNVSPSLTGLLTKDQTTLPYWLQTIMIAGYFVGLVLLYRRDAPKN